MDFKFFESLSRSEAQDFLENFLEVGSKTSLEMINAAALEYISADFSLNAIAPVLRWLLSKTNTIPKPQDEAIPLWIRETEIYASTLFELDEESKRLALCGAYYLGESMVRHSSKLRWATGDVETAEQNMPVVTGFRYSELAPLLVVENLFCRVIREPARIDEVDRAINAWIARMP